MSAGQILVRLLASEIRGDLLVLFHRNPGLIDTIDGVARRIGRTAILIEPDLKDLVDLGVLKAKKLGKSEVFLLDREKDREILESIATHVKNSGRGESA